MRRLFWYWDSIGVVFRGIARLSRACDAPSLIVEDFLLAVTTTSRVDKDLGVEMIARCNVICSVGRIPRTCRQTKLRSEHQHESRAPHHHNRADDHYGSFSFACCTALRVQ
jgi:hypothetical protein